jgi:hypothetical protein
VLDDSAACLVTRCATPIQPLIANFPGCWSCAFSGLWDRTSFQDVTTACTTDPNAGLAWKGASGVVLMSRAPISNAWQWVLPSTFMRASMVGATVRLPNDTNLDLVCVQAPAIGDGIALPYTGQYGNGQGTGLGGWQQELLLDSQKVVAHMQSRLGAPGRRTIITGFWSAGPAVAGVLPPYNADSFGVLTSAFPIGAPIGYAPACTFCTDNPYVTNGNAGTSTKDQWGNYPLLGRIPITDVASASVIMKEATITDGSTMVPVSPFYGFRSTIRVRP